MRNSLGNPARGDAFFQRDKIINKIYRVLDTGTSIYLSAPRRVGKTSILKNLEDFSKDGYCFVYVITESVYDENEFFKVLFEGLLKSDAIKQFSKLSTKFKEAISSIIGRVKSIDVIELREGEEPEYFELLKDLFENITDEHGRVVIMVDEFPQTIQNIFQTLGKSSAENFILKNRELRHHKNVQEKINFIYTGSVSLIPMVEKVTALTSINDLRTVDVEPLNVVDAKLFLNDLLLEYKITISDKVIDYTLNKIGWLIPFHIQLIEQEIIDVHETTGEEITNDTIDKAFERVVHSRNKPQFEPYFSRLTKLFKDNEYDFVIEILMIVAENDSIEKAILYDKGIKHGLGEIKQILDVLESDGYLFQVDKAYRYTSPILQQWCKKHICK
ncbi:AAA family ATPase [Cytophaga aurantiaca]|uniref:AAA family ATPase n=1 Tax=Cytophaga aurantiaca TaxID=29530 RepID=UPI00036A6883|nr:AAA family ATPase [Cytophaga aurantiaca]